MSSPTYPHPHQEEADRERPAGCPLRNRIDCVVRSQRCAANWANAVVAVLVVTGLVLAAVVWQELLAL